MLEDLRWLQTEDGKRTLQFCYEGTDWIDVPVVEVPANVTPTNPDKLIDIPEDDWIRARERIVRFKERIAGVSDPNEIKEVIKQHREEMDEDEDEDTATYNRDGITSPEGIVLDM